MKKIIKTDKAPLPVAAYTQATQHGNTLYVSGQISINPTTGELILGDVKDQTQLVMQNLKAVVEAAGSTMNHVLKCTIFLSSMEHYKAVNEVYATFFEEGNEPARECVAVAGLPANVDVEISAIVAV